MWAYLSVPYEVRLPSLERNSPQQNEAENPDEMGVSCYSMRSGEIACQCLQMKNYVITKDGSYPVRTGAASARVVHQIHGGTQDENRSAGGHGRGEGGF